MNIFLRMGFGGIGDEEEKKVDPGSFYAKKTSAVVDSVIEGERGRIRSFTTRNRDQISSFFFGELFVLITSFLQVGRGKVCALDCSTFLLYD